MRRASGDPLLHQYARDTVARSITPSDSAADVRLPGAKSFPAVLDVAAETMPGPLNWLWGHGFRFLGVLDAIALYALMVAISFVRFGFGWDWDTYPLSRYFVGFAIATMIHLIVNYFTGLYEREPRLGQRPWLPRCALATGIGVAVQALAFVALDRYLMPRLNLAVFFVLASVALVINRRISRGLARRRQGPPRVVLVGEPGSLALAQDHLVESDRDAVVVAVVDGPQRLAATVEHHAATDVLLLDASAFGAVYPEPLNTLDQRGVGFLQRVSARETLLGLRTVRQVGGLPFVPLRVHTVPAHKVRLKRIFDLVVIVLFAIVWVPILLLVALYVLARAGRPVFYRQTRVGRDGVEFRCVKFRTMVRDAEEDGRPRLATKNDPRVLPALSWMRSTRMDELPQLWNVIRGEMSLVGPRPERPELVADIVARMPGYTRRNELPPGLTGLAQVNGRYDTDAEYKLGYDLQYLVNWSLVIDAEILARTIWVVLTRRV
jgi:exopolysaccharide biosynthesis polyprenyl glycosylphosphotransferase